VTGSARNARGPVLLPLLLAGIGLLWLLANFLILPQVNIIGLLPLLLVAVGANILLRGDFVPGSDFRTFGITRGSVEAASLEISAGEIDVSLQALAGEQHPERLIAGQYAAGARPELHVEGVQAHLRLDRSSTPWVSFADWELALAQELPWQIYVSTSLGQVQADLSQVVVERALISTGHGEIRLVAPPEAFEGLRLRSTLGNIHVTTPPGARTRITVERGRLLGIHVDAARYEEAFPGLYLSRDAAPQAALVDIVISGDAGDAYLA
jgi:hypothetical protein